MRQQFHHGGNVFAIARQLGCPPEEIVDFSASINPLGPAPGVREAVAAAFDRLGHYPDSDCAPLAAALARYHGILAENVCVANGSTELIYLLPLLVPGKRALLVAPPFSEYARALTRGGWEVEYFPLFPEEGFRLDRERLARRLDREIDLLLLANPGNPTGALVERVALVEVLEFCGALGIFAVVDEAFMDFCEGKSVKRYVAEREGALVLRSMTKFFALPGLRLGYGIGAPETVARLAALREPWSVNTLAQVAGLASLSDAEYIRRTREETTEERGRLAAGLALLPGVKVYPSAANYLLVELTGGAAASGVADRLLGERLLIRECGNFVGLSERFVRVAVRGREENGRLLAALTRALS